MKTLDDFLDEIEKVGADLAKTRYANKDPIFYPLIKAAKIIREMNSVIEMYISLAPELYSTQIYMQNISKILNQGDVE